MDFGSFDITTWDGFLNWFITIASFLIPYFWKRHRKLKKKAEARSGLNATENFRIIGKAKEWVETEGKIIKFQFSHKQLLVGKKLYKAMGEVIPDKTVAIVEYKMFGKLETGEVYIGDKNFNEGETVSLKCNPLKPTELILA